jgi:hypothetical protein
MPIKYSDDSDEENVENIETPEILENARPVMASHSPDTGNGGENFVERVPEKIEFDPSKKRNFGVSYTLQLFLLLWHTKNFAKNCCRVAKLKARKSSNSLGHFKRDF